MELVDQHGHQFKLADLKGKVIFVDFWFSGCGGCIGYYNLVVSKVEPIVDKEKVVFVSICIDKDRDEWLKDIRSGKYTSEDAINVKLDNGGKSPIAKAFGLTSYPFPVLLDRTGRIYSTSTQDLRHEGPEGLLRMIEKAYNLTDKDTGPSE